MRPYLLALLFVVTTLFPMYSQIVNIESQRIHNDTTGFDGTVETGFSINQNNTLLVSATAGSHVQYKTRKDLFMLIGNWRFTNGGNQRFVNDGMIHFRYNHKFTKWLRVEGFTQVQYNELLDLRLRFLVGMGPRFKLLDKKVMNLYLGTLYMFEYENQTLSDTVEYNNRLSTYISWSIEPNPLFSFVATTYYQPKLTGWDDYRFSGNYQIRLRAFRRFVFKLDFSFFYDSSPAPNIQKFVFTGTTGLVFNLRK